MDRVEEKLRNCGFPAKYLSGDWEKVKQAKTFQSFLMETTENTKGAYLYGPPGVGKSYLMGLIAMWYYRNFADITLFFTTAVNLTSVFMDKAQSSMLRNYQLCSFLFIDDLGKEFQSAFATSQFVDLVEFRYTRYKPIFLTSNVAMEYFSEIEAYKTTFDRFSDQNFMNFFKVTGESGRKSL